MGHAYMAEFVAHGLKQEQFAAIPVETFISVYEKSTMHIRTWMSASP